MKKKMTRKEAGRLGGKANKRGPRGINVAVRLAPDMVGALNRRAEGEGVDRSAVLRAALVAYLAKRDIPAGLPSELTANWIKASSQYTAVTGKGGIVSSNGEMWSHEDGTIVAGDVWSRTSILFSGGPLDGKKLL